MSFLIFLSAKWRVLTSPEHSCKRDYPVEKEINSFVRDPKGLSYSILPLCHLDDCPKTVLSKESDHAHAVCTCQAIPRSVYNRFSFLFKRCDPLLKTCMSPCLQVVNTAGHSNDGPNCVRWSLKIGIYRVGILETRRVLPSSTKV